MRDIGAFTLHIQPADETTPTRASIVLADVQPDDRGVLHLTPECVTLDEIEACINALQDDLDVVRAQARRAFAAGPGHA